jgi:hypothetical protein
MKIHEAFLIPRGFTGKAVFRPLPGTNCLPYPFPSSAIQYVTVYHHLSAFFRQKKTTKHFIRSRMMAFVAFSSNFGKIYILLSQLLIANENDLYMNSRHLSTVNQASKKDYANSNIIVSSRGTAPLNRWPGGFGNGAAS